MSTDPTTTTVPAGPPPLDGPDREYVSWLLRNLVRPDVRGALRRGDMPAAADRAYRYLARFWSGTSWLRTPILLHAAAAASHPAVRHRADKTFGELAADLVKARVLRADTVSARLLAVQRMDLPTAHRYLNALLHTAATQRAGLDWDRFYRLYRSWDAPHLEWQRGIRRQLLEQFHTRIPG